MEQKTTYLFCEENSDIIQKQRKELLKKLRKTKDKVIIITSNDDYIKFFSNPLLFRLDKKQMNISIPEDCKIENGFDLNHQLCIFKLTSKHIEHKEDSAYNIITEAWNLAKKNPDHNIWLVIDNAELLIEDMINSLCIKSYLKDADKYHLYFTFISKKMDLFLSRNIINEEKDVIINEIKK